MAKRIDELAKGDEYTSEDEGGREKRDSLWEEIEASQNTADANDYLRRFGTNGVRITDQTAFCMYYSWMKNGYDLAELDLVTDNSNHG